MLAYCNGVDPNEYSVTFTFEDLKSEAYTPYTDKENNKGVQKYGIGRYRFGNGPIERFRFSGILVTKETFEAPTP